MPGGAIPAGSGVPHGAALFLPDRDDHPRRRARVPFQPPARMGQHAAPGHPVGGALHADLVGEPPLARCGWRARGRSTSIPCRRPDAHRPRAGRHGAFGCGDHAAHGPVEEPDFVPAGGGVEPVAAGEGGNRQDGHGPARGAPRPPAITPRRERDRHQQRQQAGQGKDVEGTGVLRDREEQYDSLHGETCRHGQASPVLTVPARRSRAAATAMAPASATSTTSRLRCTAASSTRLAASVRSEKPASPVP